MSIADLPDELLLYTFAFSACSPTTTTASDNTSHALTARARLLWVCQRWRRVAMDASLWSGSGSNPPLRFWEAMLIANLTYPADSEQADGATGANHLRINLLIDFTKASDKLVDRTKLLKKKKLAWDLSPVARCVAGLDVCLASKPDVGAFAKAFTAAPHLTSLAIRDVPVNEFHHDLWANLLTSLPVLSEFKLPGVVNMTDLCGKWFFTHHQLPHIRRLVLPNDSQPTLDLFNRPPVIGLEDLPTGEVAAYTQQLEHLTIVYEQWALKGKFPLLTSLHLVIGDKTHGYSIRPQSVFDEGNIPPQLRHVTIELENAYADYSKWWMELFLGAPTIEEMKIVPAASRASLSTRAPAVIPHYRQTHFVALVPELDLPRVADAPREMSSYSPEYEALVDYTPLEARRHVPASNGAAGGYEIVVNYLPRKPRVWHRVSRPGPSGESEMYEDYFDQDGTNPEKVVSYRLIRHGRA